MQKSLNKKLMVVGIVLLVLLGLWILISYFTTRNIETLAYKVIEKNKDYEVREYDKYILAEVEIEGDFDETLKQGFYAIFDYISGNNTSENKIAMTSPVINNSEKIAMTSPVIESSKNEEIAMTAPVINTNEQDVHKISFVMPNKYTLENLPTPNNKEVKLIEMPKQKVAVLTFSWYYSEKRLENKKLELKKFLERDGYIAKEFKFAGYNPPFTPPFMIKNEIWAILED